MELERQSEHCMVCAKALCYHEKAVDVTCGYCGRMEHGHITCPNGHYICDHCHNHDAMRVIEDLVVTSVATDPGAIAERAFSFPGLPMLGCQHAYIAGGALMAALKNEGTNRFSNDDMQEVFHRTRQQAHGGYCGLTGVCGIAPAIGAVFAIMTGSKCGKDEEQRLTMEVVSRICRAITELTGPSCCKAYVWAALDVAVEFLKENFGISLPMQKKPECRFGPKHPHGCRQARCPFQALESSAPESG